MGQEFLVDSLEELKQFLNKDGFMEVVIRGKKKKFKDFQKVYFDLSKQNGKQESVKNAMNKLNRQLKLSDKQLKMLATSIQIEKISLILNGLNLCATCVGFAIMNEKLNKISAQMNKMLVTVKQEHDLQRKFELSKAISEHVGMLDARKTQKFYSEEKLRELVDYEYNVLNLLIEAFLTDLSADQGNLILSIFSLASMLTVSLKFFDEVYYFNNKVAIGDGDVWYSNHESWMSVFDKMLDDSFVERIQDYGFLSLKLNVQENDAYYQSLSNQVNEMINEIRDNQQVIKILDDKELVSNYYQYVTRSAVKDIEEALRENDIDFDEPEIGAVYQDAIKQMSCF